MAAQILEDLRKGTVPIEHVEMFSVGRCNELREAASRLERVARGQSQLSFINGPYGSGKTHFLGMVRAEALRRSFAVTHVVLSSQSCPLDRLDTVYGALMKGLSTPQCRDRPAFRAALDAWLSTMKRELIDSGAGARLCRHYLSYYECGDGCFTKLLAERMPVLGGLHCDFATVLTAYFNANWSTDADIMQLCERWLLGEPLPATARKRIGRAAHRAYPQNVDDTVALHAFGDAARIARSIGHSGLVIMLDEAETMPSVGRGGDFSAFTNLALLMSASLRQWEAVFCVYATTPYFEQAFNRHLKDMRDAIHDEQAGDWIEREFHENRCNLALPGREDLLKLAGKVHGLYQAAAGNGCPQALPKPSWVKKKAESIADSIGPSGGIRDFVTALVREIDSFRSTAA